MILSRAVIFSILLEFFFVLGSSEVLARHLLELALDHWSCMDRFLRILTRDLELNLMHLKYWWQGVYLQNILVEDFNDLFFYLSSLVICCILLHLTFNISDIVQSFSPF